jgi:hypothetical protein
MPIDINLDRRLRVTWCKYQNILTDINNYHYKKFYFKEAIYEGKCDSQWDAEQLLKQEIREIEQKRRKEMNDIYTQVKAERERKAKEEADQQRHEKEQQLRAEKRRVMSEQRKLKQEANPIIPRRSSRIQNKETNM